MFLGILVLITALTISAVAIYYSVAGLVAIFAAAAIPIIIMGSALEIAKLVTAVWLHRYWKQTIWWLKTYLSIAVFVLMIITSMGIFGFLSKAHIEQTAQAGESVQQIEQIESLISREKSIIERANLQIDTLRTSGSSRDTEIQDQITLEQQRIDNAYSRIQPAIDEQQSIINSEESKKNTEIQLLKNQYTGIESELENLRSALSDNDVIAAQGIVGVRQDGSLGPNTERAIQNFRNEREDRLKQLQSEIQQIQDQQNPVIIAAREEISRLRSVAESQIANSTQLIERLRGQLGQTDFSETQEKIAQQEIIIDQSNDRIDEYIEQKFSLEAEYRKLEAEVGPIKYIAEFVYGDTQKDLLEEAVRWVIVMIIFVFDPLAVLLLIASQYTFELHRKTKSQDQIEDSAENTDHHDTEIEFEVEELDSVAKNQTLTASEVDPYQIALQFKKKDSRQQQLDIIEQLDQHNKNKDAWKHDHPDETLKHYKSLFLQGRIDSLPWENYLEKKQNENKSNNSTG